MRAYHRGIKPLTHPNGNLAVEQFQVGPIEVTYNPDDNRFYIQRQGEHKALHTYANTPKGWSNAITVARSEAQND